MHDQTHEHGHSHGDHAHGDHTHGDHTHEDQHAPLTVTPDRPFRVGIAGPVGSGKTTLVAALCRLLSDQIAMAVITNDIFTTEDAEALRRAEVIDPDRIVAVRTGACPHTAIRDDISANLDAAEELEARLAPLDLTLIESGGDNLTATFSRGLVDAQIFVIDTAGGDDIPRKGGPGISDSDLLVINKVDLAPYVGADTERMHRDAIERRDDRPVLLTTLQEHRGAHEVAAWILAATST